MYGTVRYGTVWYGMVLYDILCHGAVYLLLLLLYGIVSGIVRVSKDGYLGTSSGYASINLDIINAKSLLILFWTIWLDRFESMFTAEKLH